MNDQFFTKTETFRSRNLFEYSTKFYDPIILLTGIFCFSFLFFQSSRKKSLRPRRALNLCFFLLRIVLNFLRISFSNFKNNCNSWFSFQFKKKVWKGLGRKGFFFYVTFKRSRQNGGNRIFKPLMSFITVIWKGNLFKSQKTWLNVWQLKMDEAGLHTPFVSWKKPRLRFSFEIIKPSFRIRV